MSTRLLPLLALAMLGPAPASAQSTSGNPPVSAALSGGFDGAVVFRMVAESVAVIRTDAGTQGSAVALASIDGKGTAFATNCHVLTGAKNFTLTTKKGRAPGMLFAGLPEHDTCMVFAELSVPVPETFNALDLQPGEKVFAIGAPRGLDFTISEGIVSARRGDPIFDAPLLVQTTAAISPGSSGGGLFDSRGRLVGITSFRLKDAQNLNFAIAIQMYNIAMGRPTVRSLEELPKPADSGAGKKSRRD